MRSIGSPLLNHLWQTTLFVAVVWLLTLALKNNSAQLRYRLWLTASLKFFVPFSILTGLGRRLSSPEAKLESHHGLAFFMSDVSRPFTPVQSALGPPAPGPGIDLAGRLFLLVWICGFATVLVYWWLRWRHVSRLVRDASKFKVEHGIPVLLSKATIEPGVFGIFRPVLLLPAGIAEKLTQAQLETVIAHELCHVRRHDNLASALHMLVEAVFWFHPLVWWLGTRLVDDRERACDEYVVREGAARVTYAEGILKVCEFYLESPMPCVAGITGSDLKKRIEAIMTDCAGLPLNLSRKLLLSTAFVTAVIVPVAIGLGTAPLIRAQAELLPQGGPSFEVASVKPNVGDNGNWARQVATESHGTLNAEHSTLRGLIQWAYGVSSFQVTEGPGWLDSDRFDVVAKAAPQGEHSDMMAMLRKLLGERFRLTMHRVTKEAPVYVLLAGRNGPHLTEEKPDEIDPDSTCWTTTNLISEAKGEIGLEGKGYPKCLASVLSQFTDRPVVDKTGIHVVFNFKLAWSVRPDLFDVPSIYDAVQKQFGLKLEAQKAPIEVLVVDRAERPSEN